MASIVGLMISPSLAPTLAAAAPVADAYELIDAVNALRASNGMTPLRVDPILMSTAQAQNDYSLSIGQITHTGPNGSRPKERAIAAGYGGGATVFVSENIAQGTGLSASEAVQWWTGDDPHWNTMMGANYRDIGAGAGCDGDTCYYTIDTGYVAGGISANSTAPIVAGVTSAPGGALPVIQSTPQPDGSIVHTVQAGQTLWTVAAVYDIPLAQLLEQNGLTEEALLHPGDELVIRPATVHMPTSAPSVTPARTESTPAGRSPTAPPPPSTRLPAPTAAPANATAASIPGPARWLIGVVGMVLIILGIVLGSRRSRLGAGHDVPQASRRGVDRIHDD
ncbi:MAG: CAP domain-containing protein [Anaerolineales bacterium]|nr:CAP domain-containing protein [Anaerolineales bacterium]